MTKGKFNGTTNVVFKILLTSGGLFFPISSYLAVASYNEIHRRLVALEESDRAARQIRAEYVPKIDSSFKLLERLESSSNERNIRIAEIGKDLEFLRQEINVLKERKGYERR